MNCTVHECKSEAKRGVVAHFVLKGKKYSFKVCGYHQAVIKRLGTYRVKGVVDGKLVLVPAGGV